MIVNPYIVQNLNADSDLHPFLVIGDSKSIGTLAIPFGAAGVTNSNVIQIGQNGTPNLTYRCNDATISLYVTEGSFISGNAYGVGRIAGTKYLIKNGTQIASASVASTGVNTLFPTLGAFNNNSTIQNRINGEYTWLFNAVYSTSNVTTITNALNTLESAW